MKTRRLHASLLLALALTGCSAADWAVNLENLTGVPLDYCEVVTDPPPPHRECTRTLQPNLIAEIDPTDFNPAIWDPLSKLGTVVLMALDDDPPAVLVRRFQFQVEPGQQGNDMALQPVLEEEWLLTADPEQTKVIDIRVGPIAEGMPVKLTQRP